MGRFEAGEVESFGGWVESRRRVLKLTRNELAEKVGCAVVTIKKIERDERRPSLQMAALLAEHLLIPRAERDAFLRMALGGYQENAAKRQATLRLPALLQEPGILLHPANGDFVERRKELAQLHKSVSQALAGLATPAFVLGEAGSGKTSLMREFARVAQEAHPRLLVAGGQCNAQTGPGDAFRPFRDILGILTGDLEIDWIVGMLNREQALEIWAAIPDVLQAISESGPHLLERLIATRPLIDRIAPFLSEEADWLKQFQTAADKASSERERQHGGAQTGQEQSQVVEELTQTFRAIAARHPLLLLLDDLQWADDASLNLLYHVARRLAGSQILLVGAYRPGESRGGQASVERAAQEIQQPENLILELARQYGDIQIRLDQTSPTEGRAFIDALLDRQPNRLDEQFRDDLYRHTRGQALFTVEMLQSMRQNQEIVLDEGGYWVENSVAASRQLPVRVEAVIAQRLGRLTPAQRRLLEAGSVQGEVFTAEVAANVLPVELETALQLLTHDLSRKQRLLQEQGQVPVRERSLNRFQFVHMLVREYLYGELDAGEKRHLHRRTAEELEKILAVDAGSRVAPEYLDAFGPALLHHFEAGEVWAKAAAYAYALGGRARQGYAMREAMAYYARALNALDRFAGAPEALLIDVQLAWVEAAFKFRPYEEQLKHLASAEGIARTLDDKPRLIQVLEWTANVLLARGRWSQAGPSLLEALALAEAAGDEELSVRPLYFKALMTSFGDPPQSLAGMALAKELSRKYANQQIEALAFATEAQVLAELGDFEGARNALDVAHVVAQQVGSPVLESDVDHFAAWAWLAMGNMSHAMEFGQRSRNTALATDNMDCSCGATVCIGYVNLELGKIAEATASFEEGIRRSEAAGALIHRQEGEAGLAMARFLSGHQDAVEELRASIMDMKSIENRVGAAGASQLLGTCLTALGQFEQASSAFSEAIEFYRTSRMHPFLGRALEAMAELMDKHGRRAEAQRYRTESESIHTLSGDAH